MPIRVIRKANGTPNFHFGENMWNDMLIREIENKDSNIMQQLQNMVDDFWFYCNVMC